MRVELNGYGSNAFEKAKNMHDRAMGGDFQSIPSSVDLVALWDQGVSGWIAVIGDGWDVFMDLAYSLTGLF